MSHSLDDRAPTAYSSDTRPASTQCRARLAQGNIGSNGYVGAIEQVELLSLNPDAHTLVDAYGQRVAAAIQAGNESLIPQAMDVMPS